MNIGDVSMTSVDARSFFGHPKGLFFLAFTEAWERFSFYGMTVLLVLYMVNQLLLPGHVEHVAGFAGFRSALESVTEPLSTLGIASLIYGLYSGFVYFTPVFGGLIADRWIGQRNAVVTGARRPQCRRLHRSGPLVSVHRCACKSAGGTRLVRHLAIPGIAARRAGGTGKYRHRRMARGRQSAYPRRGNPVVKR